MQASTPSPDPEPVPSRPSSSGPRSYDSRKSATYARSVSRWQPLHDLNLMHASPGSRIYMQCTMPCRPHIAPRTILQEGLLYKFQALMTVPGETLMLAKACRLEASSLLLGRKGYLPDTNWSKCGCRTLSWGGARLDEDQLQERAMRITGTHMDELMDGLAQGQPAPQTSLQNAILVRLASPQGATH